MGSRVVPINYRYPKLTGILLSYTCIGWKYSVSKSLLRKTKFSLSLYPNKVNDISAVCFIIQGVSKKKRRSFCLISLAKKMLQGSDISHIKADMCR